MEFDGDIAKFNFFDELKNHNDNQFLSCTDMVNVFVQEPSGSKVTNEADMKGKNILHHDSSLKLKHAEERGSTTDKVLKGKGYK